MLEIIQKLDDGGEDYKNKVLESLYEELKVINEKINIGLSPDEYGNHDKYKRALESSIVILNKYNS